MAHECARDGRKGIDGSAAVRLDEIERLPGLEPALQHQRCPMRDGGWQRIHGAVSPKQRNRDEDAIVAGQRLTLTDIEPVLYDSVLHHPHALGPAARA